VASIACALANNLKQMPNKAIFIGPAPWAHDDSEGRARARPRLAIGIAISLAVHLLLAVFMPKPLEVEGVPNAAPIEVRLMPRSGGAPPPSQVARAEPPPKPPVSQRRTLTAPPSAKPAPFTVPEAPPQSVQPPQPPQPPQPIRPPEPDQPQTMAELVARNQARRAEADAAAARYNAAGRAAAGDQSGEEIRAANLARNLKSLALQPDGTNGVFQIVDKGTRRATFTFREWTTDALSSKRRTIEVDAGQGGDVELAIVRRMIELIREHYDGDFKWESHKQGRVITMSARKKDNEELERFLMREFDFGPVRQANGRQ
jgi:hypothetical protein